MKTFIKIRVGVQPDDVEFRARLQPFRVIAGHVVELIREFDDPIVTELFAPSQRGETNSRWFVSNFEIDFRYTKAELDAATWFYGRVTKGSNDFCDQERTRYDTSVGCPFCSVGQVQLSPLILPNISRHPSQVLFRLANGNYICRRDFAEAIVEENHTGFRLIPVATSIKMTTKMEVDVAAIMRIPPESSQHVREVNERAIAMPEVFAYQLCAAATIDISPQVWIGVSLFSKERAVDTDQCPMGHTLGHRLLSPLAITGSANLKYDFHATVQHIGGFGGYFRPARQLLFSPKAAALIARFRNRGIEIDPLICTK